MILLFLVMLAAVPALADVEGVVATASGQPIEGAIVIDEASGESAVSDGRGHFRLRGVEPPLSLRIDDPRFEPLVVQLPLATAAPETFTLTPKQTVYEKVVASAEPGREAVGPASSASTAVEPTELAAPAATLVEMATQAPGVAETGQGGRFQAYSVRGIAGQRVFTTVAGMRIVTERRAGATASFIDPAILRSVEVVRGPASTLHGSGALGGVVQALPRQLDGTEVEVGYASQGDEGSLFAGWGNEEWDAALAVRDADDGENGDGDFLFNHSTQWTGLLRKGWERPSGTTFELLAMPAVARDIAKPNTRYPDRITQYPEENHLLVRFAAHLANDWHFGASIHPNDLETENLRSTSRSLVTNESFDWGLDAKREFAAGGAWTVLAGADVFGRSDVTATEDLEDFGAGTTTETKTLDGSEEQLALFGTARRPIGRATFEAGARLTWINQENLGTSSDDTAESAFVGVTVPLGAGFELAANAGTGLRFPSLSERFFTGSTGAGAVVANDDLDPERSLSGDLGVRYFGKRLFVEVFGFHTEIDDYIEQDEIMTDVTTFVNLTEGTITGAELAGSYAFDESFRLLWSGAIVDGDNDAGGPLAEIPSDRAALGARYVHGPWRAAARIEHRFDKNDPGPSEVEVEDADLLSASVSRGIGKGLGLRLFGTNLLDETYVPTADELAVAAPGRSVGVSLAWAQR